MLKFGFRNKQFYPLMLLLFAFLRKGLEIIMDIHPYKENDGFVIMFLLFFSQALVSSVMIFYFSKKDTIEIKPQIFVPVKSSFIKFRNSNDSKTKIIFLIIFGSVFYFVGCVIRTNDVVYLGNKIGQNSQLEVRVRSIQIIISALICYFTMRLTIYKHQKLSMILISIFLIFIIITEFVVCPDLLITFISLLICTTSCTCRAFMDITEKYLFDCDYINIFKMLQYEGIIGTILYLIFFSFNKTYHKQGSNLLKDMSEFGWNFVSFLFLMILYIIISGLRNVYRVTTNKYYSPMSRALIESTLDPFIFLFNSLTIDQEKYFQFWSFFGIIIFCLTVISFFSLVYNDFIILYCCNLEHDTYKEINFRLNSEVSNIQFDNEPEKELTIYANGDVSSEGSFTN